MMKISKIFLLSVLSLTFSCSESELGSLSSSSTKDYDSNNSTALLKSQETKLSNDADFKAYVKLNERITEKLRKKLSKLNGDNARKENSLRISYLLNKPNIKQSEFNELVQGLGFDNIEDYRSTTLSIIELANKIKRKYPEFSSISNASFSKAYKESKKDLTNLSGFSSDICTDCFFGSGLKGGFCYVEA
ncbi:hypothetical protein FY528_16850 [Hymenobacter lutimineralis]|uniref:Uncharacterized protein n=1 Tax=Hymenobacter lutimineralis TaxID=2606448 RepID=A0A5D6UVL2_9BACT|nr:hypothetical protein [Hymenobacter lutimineralis]TYZ06938.1 hypothetical protein FY528_16850 [Hymenobacter lutimineralis]